MTPTHAYIAQAVVINHMMTTWNVNFSVAKACYWSFQIFGVTSLCLLFYFHPNLFTGFLAIWQVYATTMNIIAWPRYVRGINEATDRLNRAQAWDDMNKENN
jgi:hypothetical protein